MSEIISVPQWLQTKTNEQASEQFLRWIAATKAKLLKAFPQGERAFSRIFHKMKVRLPRRYDTRLRYTRQKHFLVAPGIVFFGDFYFCNLRLLVEIDGAQHNGTAAKEKDEWRSKLISMWKVQTVRFTNDQVMSGDLRDVEAQFLAACAAVMPPTDGGRLVRDYRRIQKEHPAIYAAPGILTTW